MNKKDLKTCRELLRKEKSIIIIIETIDDRSAEIKIDINNNVSQLMEKAMKKLSIERGLLTYELVYNGILLNPDLKIEAYNISNNGMVLLLCRPRMG